MKYSQLNKAGKIQFFSLIGITTALVVVSIILGFWWIGAIIASVVAGFMTAVSIAASKVIKDLETSNKDFIKKTQFKDIRYMTDEQHKKFEEKGYFITEDGIPITKNDIKEI